MQPPGRSIRFDDPRSAAAEQGIIKLLYLDPGLFRGRTNVPDAAQFSSPELRHIYTVLLAHGGTGTVQIAALSGELSPDELALLTGIIQQPAELVERRARARRLHKHPTDPGHRRRSVVGGGPAGLCKATQRT